MSLPNKMFYVTTPAAALSGDVTVPGDKSISHRALMLGAIANGVTHVTGFLPGEDNRATLNVMRALGVTVDEISDTELAVHGRGMHGLTAATQVLDCGNAGTAIRLLVGLLAAQPFNSVLTGDIYLRKRPMRRVTDPLALMGAKIDTQAGCAPLTVIGGQNLQGITFDMPIASAQVKSCLLLAALYARGTTTIIEHGTTRDHTERMLTAMGYPLSVSEQVITLEGGHSLSACDIRVPADISSAAFFMVAAAITPNSCITLKNVGINPTRDGVIQILNLMGAKIEIKNKRQFGDEPVADITVSSSVLTGIEIPQQLVPLAIDELPVLMIAAAHASGTTVLKGAKELRVKETDRIAAMANGLMALGAEVVVFDDGMQVKGGVLQGGVVDSCGDHRIAMAFAVAGLVAAGSIRINNTDNVATSFPDFVNLARQLGFHLTVGANDDVKECAVTQVPAITLDGPSGTGKSTIAKRLADALGFTYLDSGALYRALAWTVVQHSVDINNNDALSRCINAACVTLTQSGAVVCDGQDISAAIRQESIGMMASKISSNPLVRKRLLQLQRDQRKLPGMVTDGRDMGTVVFPDAKVKIYLTASSHERAKRRFNQLKEKGIDGNLRDIEEELNIRDQQDSERSIAPLKPADDAIIIDTSDMGAQQVFDDVLKIVRSRLE